MSNSSAAIWVRAISTPWPISTLPTASFTLRSGWNRSHLSMRRLLAMLRGRVSLMIWLLRLWALALGALARRTAAAFSTARTMRGCAPQRHRCLSSAATMSAREGSLLASSNALADIRMPDRQ